MHGYWRHDLSRNDKNWALVGKRLVVSTHIHELRPIKWGREGETVVNRYYLGWFKNLRLIANDRAL